MTLTFRRLKLVRQEPFDCTASLELRRIRGQAETRTPNSRRDQDYGESHRGRYALDPPEAAEQGRN